MPLSFLGALVAIALVLAPACVDKDTRLYAASIEAWQAERENGLREENSWLTLVGLFWLEPGENDFGSGPSNRIVLPDGAAPEKAGTFIVDSGEVSVHTVPGVELSVGGRPVTDAVLASDAEGKPDHVRLGRLDMYVIERGGRLGVRVKDPESPVRTGFDGLEFFPADPAFEVAARFVPHDPPREIQIPTVLGTSETMLAPGIVEFELMGRAQRLEPVVGSLDDDKLFFIFKDATSGEETYGAGRFMYTELPQDGRVTLDFNRAYNPPCAYTAFATCPLPPRQNRLDVRVEAGEKTYGDH